MQQGQRIALGGRADQTHEAPEIHLNAPAGAAGPGYFRDAHAPGVLHDSDCTDCARGPAERYLLAAADAAPLNAAATAKPPPKTQVSKKSVKVNSTTEQDVDISVEVLADSSSSDAPANGAHTSFKIPSFTTPGYSWQMKGGKKVVTALSGRFEWKGSITIQTLYGSGAGATDPSLYGRGTTKPDQAAGNTTLGFHENCHQQDYLKFIDDNPLPDFTGTVGMTTAEFDKAVADFKAAHSRYRNDMKAYSDNLTDEVGYTKSDCKRDGKCK